MAKNKSKIDILEKYITVDTEMQLDGFWYWMYAYEDYYYDRYDDFIPDDACWSYIENIYDYMIIQTYGVKKILTLPSRGGAMIDMNTIYPKHILREKKINQILGLEYHSMYKPTLAEYFPKNKNLNEDRDI